MKDTNQQFAIVETRHWYGPRKTVGIVYAPDGIALFDTRADARAWIDDVDGCPYEFANNECSRPEYSITRVTSKRFAATA